MVDVVASPSRVAQTSYVEWSAIIAGAVVASAISFVLLTAGASIGLSLVSPHPPASYGKLAGSFAAFWLIAVPIFSLLIGGYIAGRMRASLDGATPDEVEFRDGIQGLLVWGVSIVIGGTLAFLTAASAAQLGGDVARAAVSDRQTMIASAVDTMLRPAVIEPVATDAPAPTPKVAPSPTPGMRADATAPDARDTITRVLAASVVAGSLDAQDRSYLAQVIATRTGLTMPEAEKRVDEAYASAVDAVEKARKAAVATGLATATALLLGLVAAWYAAQRGGRHRDENIPVKIGLAGALRRRMPTRPS